MTKRIIIGGVAAGVAMFSFPDWNWYGFPTVFTLLEATDYIVGMLVAGLVLAAIIKPRTPAPAAA